MKRYWFWEWREAAGLTQVQMARILGITQTSLSRIENNARDFTGDFLADFQQVVGCTNISDPINGPPPKFPNRGGKVSDEKLDMMRMELARDIRRRERAWKEAG